MARQAGKSLKDPGDPKSIKDSPEGHHEYHERPVAVIGDGWSALGLCGFLSNAGRAVTWIAGTGSRIVSPLPTLDAASVSPGAETWGLLIHAMGIEAGELQTGSFLREFRNKAFREPPWTKAPTPEGRLSVRDEVLWSAERRLAPLFEARYALGLAEIEGQLREKLLAEEGLVRRIEGVHAVSIELRDGRIEAIQLASGERIACDRVFYADRWSEISRIAGVPKGLALAREREPMGALQAVFSHELPMAIGVQEGFCSALHKEAGEEIERHVWGYFSSGGEQSYWTICLSPEEVDDNHAIAKKLRKMKNALEKMFSSTEWMPAGKPDFMSNVKEEKVRFEEAILFAAGDPPAERVGAPGIEGLSFLTDGYGPTSALQQVRVALEAGGFSLPAVEISRGTDTEAESTNPSKTPPA